MIEFADPWVPPKPRNKVTQRYVTELRDEFGLSQEGMAEVLGVSRAMIAAVETGRRELALTEAEIRETLEALEPERKAFRDEIAKLLG